MYSVVYTMHTAAYVYIHIAYTAENVLCLYSIRHYQELKRIIKCLDTISYTLITL